MPGLGESVEAPHRRERFDRISLGTHLHPDRIVVADVVNRPQHKRIVDLARRRLVAARMIGDLIITDQVVIFADVPVRFPSLICWW